MVALREDLDLFNEAFKGLMLAYRFIAYSQKFNGDPLVTLEVQGKFHSTNL